VLEVAIMVEGQEGVGWDRWRRLALAVEDLGYAGLYRSDHFPNKRTGVYRDGLELWSSLAWLAENTSRIEFGPLVSPVSFRHPVITAWQASSVDNLAGGRLRLGLGAGWNEWEHETFGFDVLDTDRRFARFVEGLEVVTSLLRNESLYLSTVSSTRFATPCSCRARRVKEGRLWSSGATVCGGRCRWRPATRTSGTPSS
jgi:alkanesulfonate monooxygenase SsuD/methylene tetrahydromethanopterin reductase-like flavin-dependent oxidoreductase (luciferase family)